MRLSVLAAFLVVTPVSAQSFVSVHAGAAEFDLAGTGSAFVADVRYHRPLSRVLAVEGGVGLTSTSQQFGVVTYLLPSVELQAGVPLGRVARPFIAVGLGAFVPMTGPDQETEIIGGREVIVQQGADTDGAVVLGLGLDVNASDRVLLRTAVRLRGTASIDGPDVFGSTFGEVTAGLGYRF